MKVGQPKTSPVGLVSKMVSWVSKTILRVQEMLRSPSTVEIVAVTAVLAFSLLAGGLVYGLVTQTVAFIQGASVRLILGGTLQQQTYSEIVVVATYYLLGFLGTVLYASALTGRKEHRTTKYMLLFSFLLLLLSFLGLSSSFLSKFTR